MGHPVTKVSEVHVTGPLEPFAGDVKAGLLAAGYAHSGENRHPFRLKADTVPAESGQRSG